MARNDPLRNFRFKVEVDNAEMGFSEVAIAETATDAIEYREGSDPAHLRKLSGLTKYGNITLKYGATTNSKKLFDWHQSIVLGQVDKNRKKVTVIVLDDTGSPKARFLISEAWPVKYHSSDLNGKGNEVVIELLELANEGIERVA